MATSRNSDGTIVIRYEGSDRDRHRQDVVRLADGPRAARPAPHEWRRRNAAPRSIKGSF